MKKRVYSKKQIKAIKSKSNKPLNVNAVKLLLMNTINPSTRKYYTEEEVRKMLPKRPIIRG